MSQTGQTPSTSSGTETIASRAVSGIRADPVRSIATSLPFRLDFLLVEVQI